MVIVKTQFQIWCLTLPSHHTHIHTYTFKITRASFPCSQRMQKATRNSQTCTNGILTWPENSSPVAAVTGHRSHQVTTILLNFAGNSLDSVCNLFIEFVSLFVLYTQPSDDIGDVLRGKKVSENEAQNLAKW